MDISLCHDFTCHLFVPDQSMFGTCLINLSCLLPVRGKETAFLITDQPLIIHSAVMSYLKNYQHKMHYHEMHEMQLWSELLTPVRHQIPLIAIIITESYFSP